MAEDSTANLSERAIVCDRVLYSTGSLLKDHLKRRALTRPQTYARLFEGDGLDVSNNLDRLSIFRFGGNRGSNSKVRDRDKKEGEQRLREFSDRLKKVPIPPPRTKNTTHRHQQLPAPSMSDTREDNMPSSLPVRSASFSQVDYSPGDKKYVRRRPQASSSHDAEHTLPRTKVPWSINTKANLNVSMNETFQGLKNFDSADIVSSSQLEKCISDEKQKAQEKKRDKLRRREGMYISQWPDEYQTMEDVLPQFQDCDFSLSVETKSVTEIPKVKINNNSMNSLDETFQEPTSPDDSLTSIWSNLTPDEKSDNDLLKINSRKILLRVDSFSESEPDQIDRRSDRFTNISSDFSDSETRLVSNSEVSSPHVPRRYSKRPLRGPYGQMLEAEMKKPEGGRKNQLNSDLKFLEDLSIRTDTPNTLSLSPGSLSNPENCKYNSRNRITQSQSVDDMEIKNKDSSVTGSTKPVQVQSVTKRKVSVDGSINHSNLISDKEHKLVISHQRTTSSPSKLEGYSTGDVSNELLNHLLHGSFEQLISETGLQRHNVSITCVFVT